MKSLNNVNDNIKKINDRVNVLNNNLVMKNSVDMNGTIFSKEDLIELDEALIDDRYRDSFYTTSLGLYTYSKDLLKKKYVAYKVHNYYAQLIQSKWWLEKLHPVGAKNKNQR